MSCQDRSEEYLMMGLRLVSGLSFARLMGLGSDDGMPARLSAMRDAGMIDWTDDTIAATPRGRNLLNAVLRELLAG